MMYLHLFCNRALGFLFWDIHPFQVEVVLSTLRLAFTCMRGCSKSKGLGALTRLGDCIMQILVFGCLLWAPTHATRFDAAKAGLLMFWSLSHLVKFSTHISVTHKRSTWASKDTDVHLGFKLGSAVSFHNETSKQKEKRILLGYLIKLPCKGTHVSKPKTQTVRSSCGSF